MHRTVCSEYKIFFASQPLSYLRKSQKFQLKWNRRPLNTTGKFRLVSQATTFANESGADIPTFWTNYPKNLISLKEICTRAIDEHFVWKISFSSFYMEAFCFEASLGTVLSNTRFLWYWYCVRTVLIWYENACMTQFFYKADNAQRVFTQFESWNPKYGSGEQKTWPLGISEYS